MTQSIMAAGYEARRAAGGATAGFPAVAALLVYFSLAKSD